MTRRREHHVISLSINSPPRLCERIRSLEDCNHQKRCPYSAISMLCCYAFGCTLPEHTVHLAANGRQSSSLSSLNQFCCCHTDGTLEQRTGYSSLERTRTAGKQHRRRNGDLHWRTCLLSLTHPCCCNSNSKTIRINERVLTVFVFYPLKP